MTAIDGDKQPKQRKWWRYFSIILAIVLIIIILRSISIDALLESLRTVDTGLLFVAWWLNIVVVLLMAYRWRILYNIVDEPPTYQLLTRVTFVSIFFNTILPSIVGGDTYRTVSLGKGSKQSDMEQSFSVIFVDRIMGLVGLMVLGCLGLILNRDVVIPPIVTALTVILLTAFIALLILSMFNPVYQFLLRTFSWLSERHFRLIESILTRIHSNIALYRKHKLLLWQALFLALVQRLCWLVAGYIISESLDLNLTVMTFIVFLPIIEIIRLIPITIQGIGVREGLFILFFGTVGVVNADAVLLATLIYLMSSLIGLLGGAIYLLDNLRNLKSS